MRIRKFAKLYGSNAQEIPMRDEKFVEETIAMEDHGNKVCNPVGDVSVKESGQNVEEPFEQQREEDSRRDENIKKVVDEIGLVEDEHDRVVISICEDVSLSSIHQNDSPPLKLRGEDSSKDEKKGKSIEDEDERAMPIGDVLRVSGESLEKKNHFSAFGYNVVRYNVEDSVMFNSEEENNKPYVGIIRDIFQNVDGKMMVKVQWFYRPEDIKKTGGENFESTDARMLFYSFHLDDVPAETVLHKCIVHFVPLDKQIPYRKKFPGFIVQQVYDATERKLFKFTDKVFARNKKEEIDVLIQKTISRIGELSDKDPKVRLKKNY